MNRLSLPALLCFFLILIHLPVTAQKKDEDPSSRQSPQATWTDERSFKAISEAYELLSNNQLQEAETRFSELTRRFKVPYERSEAMRGLAQVYVSTDRMEQALMLMEEVINMDVLPNRTHFESMVQLASLYYSIERYEDALRWLDRWTAESGRQSAQVFELKASIYAQQQQYRLALTEIDLAIALEEEPKKTWYQLKLVMHYELKEFLESKTVLQTLVRKWPEDKQFWTQLSSINVTLKNDDEALAVLVLAHRKGLLSTEQEWIQLYSLYGVLGLPYNAAEILAEGIDRNIIDPTKRRWEELGNAWHGARELDRAVVALTKAAELSLDGKLDLRIAHMLIEKEDWSNAIIRLNAAIDKGGMNDPEIGNVFLLLGMAQLNSGSNELARQAFKSAEGIAETRASAKEWLNHMDQKAKTTQVAVR